MPPPIIADRMSAAEQLLNDYATARGTSDQCQALAAGLRQLLEVVRLLTTQDAEQARTLNSLAGRVEVLEKRPAPDGPASSPSG
jgi:hypothetical protein